MNIEHKKTTLDDDSILYQKRGDSVTKKQDIKNLSKKEKLFYFKDYYLKVVIVIIIAAIAAGTLANSMFFNRQTNILSVSFVNDSYLTDTEGLQNAITEYFAPENKNDYITVSNFNTEDYQIQMAFSTQLMAGAIDIIVCSEDYFEANAKLGAFMDLKAFLSDDLYEKLSDKMIESREEDTDYLGEVISYGELKPYGISLTGNDFYQKFGGFNSNAILCVAGNAPNPENAVKLIEWFMEAAPAE